MKDKNVNEFDGSYNEYVKEKNKIKINKAEKINTEKLLLMQIELSEVISMLSIENDVSKK